MEVPNECLVEALETAVALWPGRVAVDFMGASTTYQKLGEAVCRGASVLDGYGIRKGDRVAISLPNCTSHMVAFYSVLRLGAIVVEVNPAVT